MFSWQHMRITNPLYLSSGMPFGTSGTADDCAQLAVGVDYKSAISIVRDALRNIRDIGKTGTLSFLYKN
jgi:hypothetical protein